MNAVWSDNIALKPEPTNEDVNDAECEWVALLVRNIITCLWWNALTVNPKLTTFKYCKLGPTDSYGP